MKQCTVAAGQSATFLRSLRILAPERVNNSVSDAAKSAGVGLISASLIMIYLSNIKLKLTSIILLFYDTCLKQELLM